MKSVVRQIAILVALQKLAEVERQQLGRQSRRRRHVVVVFGKRVLEHNISCNVFDLVEAAFD